VSNFSRLAAVITTAVVVTATLTYGHWFLVVEQAFPASTAELRLRLALIQGNSSPDMKFDPSSERQIMNDYIDLSEKAIAKARQVGDGRPVDLVIWPETIPSIWLFGRKRCFARR
jgi:apolipoprotein N-acyltransferase